MVEIIPAHDRLDAFLDLVRAYTDGILAQGSEVGATLCAQHLEDELSHIERKYGPPRGRMYIALADGAAAGCAALAPMSDTVCEIKRLYVRPSCRGQRIGQKLVEQIICDARQLGYARMRLDTFPFMKRAIRLYEAYGFRYIDKYNDNPADTAIFMELSL